MEQTQGQTLIRGPQLRKRWGMSNTAFYAKLKKGVIPPPTYPFQDNVPYWAMSEIEDFERKAAAASTRPLPSDPTLRRKKRAEAHAEAR
jgi:predicted DNA-binding transcriptional regulator AlpA